MIEHGAEVGEALVVAQTQDGDQGDEDVRVELKSGVHGRLEHVKERLEDLVHELDQLDALHKDDVLEDRFNVRYGAVLPRQQLLKGSKHTVQVVEAMGGAAREGARTGKSVTGGHTTQC